MTKLKQIYKCNVCGNIVEVLHTGFGELVCCGQAMQLQEEKDEDEGQEKHVPVIERTEKGIKVKVGDVPHPMEEEHFIEWIEVSVDGRYCRKFLKPGDSPEAEFDINGENISAREYCNVHGLWKSQ
ncbi:MAG: desulfoferrodoxin [Candidatus Paceibacterota bacterium]